MGGVLVAVGAVLLAAKGLFAKVLYSLGLTFHDVAAIRSVMAVPGFALLAWLHWRIVNQTGESRSTAVTSYSPFLPVCCAITLARWPTSTP
ncbi:MAG: hypothetical protein CM15mP74_22680 [Halieaceae bacterium]|nr:MAG: hypothetical protein CM15mP74_22680 [Halieaceae bacterium]